VLYTWPVSTGMSDYDTPTGEFQPFRMERDHFSREWDDAPMGARGRDRANSKAHDFCL